MNIEHLKAKPSSSEDCMRCGLCCTSVYACEQYVEIEPEEVGKFSGYYRREHVLREFDRFALRASVREHTRGHLADQKIRTCVAFRGVLGVSCKCGIYPVRPNACADFRPGNAACLKARSTFVEAIEAGKPEEAIA